MDEGNDTQSWSFATLDKSHNITLVSTRACVAIVRIAENMVLCTAVLCLNLRMYLSQEILKPAGSEQLIALMKRSGH